MCRKVYCVVAQAVHHSHRDCATDPTGRNNIFTVVYINDVSGGKNGGVDVGCGVDGDGSEPR